MARHFAGQSIRGIARAEGRDRETVAKIIQNNADCIGDYVDSVNEKFHGLANIALVTLARGVKSSGWLALRYLEAVGVFPIPQEEPPAVRREPTAAEIEEAKIQAACARFAAKVYERSRAFESPLVDSEKDLQADEGKLNGTANHNERTGEENDKPSPAARRCILNFKDEDKKS